MKRSMDKLLEKGRDKELTKEELEAAQVRPTALQPLEISDAPLEYPSHPRVPSSDSLNVLRVLPRTQIPVVIQPVPQVGSNNRIL